MSCFKRERTIMFCLILLTLTVIFLVPVLILTIIRCLDQKMPLSIITRITDGDGIWFSFWGSYLGCIATVVLGIITIRLDRKINRYTWCKNTVDEISQFNSFSVCSVCLESVIDNFILPELEQFSGFYDQQRFLLIVKFKSFPSYYEVKEEALRWGTEQDVTVSSPVERTLRISNDNEHTSFNYLLDSDDINRFFYVQNLNPEAMTRIQRQRCIELQLYCKNILYSDDPGYYRPFRVTIQITIENIPGNSNNSESKKAGSPSRLRIVNQRISCQQVTNKK